MNVESKQDLAVIQHFKTTAFTRYKEMSNSDLYIFTDLIKAPDCEAVIATKKNFEAKLLGTISLSMQQQTQHKVECPIVKQMTLADFFNE